MNMETEALCTKAYIPYCAMQAMAEPLSSLERGIALSGSWNLERGHGGGG